MPLFRRSGKANEMADSTEKLDGFIAANISVTKKPQYREVTVLIIDCATGDTLYKTTYRTKARSDYAAYNFAIDLINVYAVTENVVLQDTPTTNAQLPSITVHQKGGRW